MVLSLVAMGWALGVAREWIWVTVVIAVFSAVSSFLAVGLVFERVLLTPESTRSRGALRRAITGGAGGALAIYVSQWAPRELAFGVVPLMGATFAFVLVMAHVVMIPARDVVDTLARLKKGARKSLFAAPSADEDPTADV